MKRRFRKLSPEQFNEASLKLIKSHRYVTETHLHLQEKNVQPSYGHMPISVVVGGEVPITEPT